MPVDRKPIFDAVRALIEAATGKARHEFTRADVRLLDAGIDAAMGVTETIASPKGRTVSPKGIALMHDFEGCRLEAYPDPGSKDGHPWTIGWGSTGPGIGPGVVWTQAQADERFAADLNAVYGKAVNDMLGDAPTTQHQFDALVSLCYNIGPKALRGSTVMRLHKAGDYKGAARAFLMWNKNDGKVMRGLTRRRLAEADLYDDL